MHPLLQTTSSKLQSLRHPVQILLAILPCSSTISPPRNSKQVSSSQRSFIHFYIGNELIRGLIRAPFSFTYFLSHNTSVHLSSKYLLPEDFSTAKTGFSITKVDYFQTDTSDVEELLDSSGAETTKASPIILIPVEKSSTTGSKVSKEAEHTSGGGIAASKFLSPTRPLSASARTLINQHFTETNPSILPVGHSTVVFNQGQVHSILRAVSSETLVSSVHLMKNMLEEAMRIGARSKGGSQGTGRQKVKWFRKQPEGSEGGGQDSDPGTEGYTSGALSSDDEFVINSQRRTREAIIVSPPSPISHNTTPTEGQSTSYQVPSPGYCATDYEPLVNLAGDHTPNRSHPRKRRRLQGQTGKIMMEAYFKGIQWTRTFVTGPLDPEHNKHKFYCQICKTNVSICSKGAREIVPHFQCDSHFRKDQCWRFEHLKKKDRVIGREVYEVRGKNGQVLTPLELEKEKNIFLKAPLVETGCGYPFNDDYMAGLGSVAGQEEIRQCVLISMVALFAPRCGDLHVVVEHCVAFSGRW